jgi:hypothetical protein
VTEEGTAPVAKSTGGNSPGLLVIGAGVIVAGWVLLGILAGEWNPGAIYIVLSLIVLLSAYNVAGINVGTGTQRVIGYFMGLAALVIVIADLRFDGFPEDGLRILAYVVFVAGCVLMFIGARALSD